MRRWLKVVLDKTILAMRRQNLEARTIWIMLVTTVIPILIIGVGAFVGARHVFERNTYNSIQKSIDLYGMLLDNQLAQYAQIGDELAANLETINLVANRHAKTSAQYARINNYYQYIEKLFTRHMITVEIVAEDGFVLFRPYQFTGPDVAGSACLRRAFAASERRTWFGALAAENTSAYSRPPESMSDAEVMLSTKIRSLTGRHVGLVNLVVSGSMLSDILKEAMAYESDASFPFNVRSIFIVDDMNRVVSGEGLTPGAQVEPQLAAMLTSAGTGRIREADTGRETLVFHAASRQSGFRVVSTIDYADFMRDINALQRRIIWLVLACELIAAAIWWLHALSIKRPIGRIVRAMKHMEAKELGARVTDGGRDELNYLAESFNAMAAQIQNLVEETRRIESSKREAEMRALEAQINPHFLYNTLDMISWMAFQSKTDEIRRMIGALSNFFRLSLNRGRRTYRVQDELDHVKAYLDIQRERFQAKERFSLCVEADEEARGMRVIKILLQPLVENAITHGLMKKPGVGSLTIGAKVEGERLMLWVEDDGVGLEKAAGDHSFHSGYGLRSVEERIRQYYGEAGSLSVTQRPEGGVRALIILPAVKWEERDRNVQNPVGG